MAMVVIGTVFVDIKGFPDDLYIPEGRNAGRVEIVHGGVGRNVAEDIANVELRPRFVGMVDDTAEGAEVLRKLKNHKVNTDYVAVTQDGMGMWLAVFNNGGDIAGSISKRPTSDAMLRMLEEKGDEIFADADSIVIEIDLDKELIKTVFRYAEKYHKKVYAVVANMSIASQRRDFLQSIDRLLRLQRAGGGNSVRLRFQRPDSGRAVRGAVAARRQRADPLYGRHDGQPRRGVCRHEWRQGRIPCTQGQGTRHYRRWRRVLRGRCDWPDLRQDDARSGRDRHAARVLGHHRVRERLPPFPPAGAGSGRENRRIIGTKPAASPNADAAGFAYLP